MKSLLIYLVNVHTTSDTLDYSIYYFDKENSLIKVAKKLLRNSLYLFILAKLNFIHKIYRNLDLCGNHGQEYFLIPYYLKLLNKSTIFTR